MVRRDFRNRRFLVLLVVVVLVLSAYFSFNSFTGYVVSEKIDTGANMISLGLFFTGIIGSYFLFWRRR
jgi:predicted MFS family arabinose efflux permease